MYQEVEATPVIELVRVLHRPCLLDLSIGEQFTPGHFGTHRIIWYPLLADF
jgi:hypothetical protein